MLVHQCFHRTIGFDRTVLLSQSKSQEEIEKRCPHSDVSDTIVQSRLHASTSPQNGPLAQLAEHRTFNPGVVGSTPTRPTYISHTKPSDTTRRAVLRFTAIWPPSESVIRWFHFFDGQSEVLDSLVLKTWNNMEIGLWLRLYGVIYLYAKIGKGTVTA